MKTCQQCGAQMKDNYMCCPQCGAEQIGDAQSFGEAGGKKTGVFARILGIAGFALSAIGLILVLCLLGDGESIGLAYSFIICFIDGIAASIAGLVLAGIASRQGGFFRAAVKVGRIFAIIGCALSGLNLLLLIGGLAL